MCWWKIWSNLSEESATLMVDGMERQHGEINMLESVHNNPIFLESSLKIQLT